MSTLVALWHRLVALVRRGRLECDLDEEIGFHLAMRERDYRSGGAGADVARDRDRTGVAAAAGQERLASTLLFGVDALSAIRYE